MPKNGFITASMFATVLQNGTKDELFGKTAKRYAVKLAMQIIGADTTRNEEGSYKQTEHGNTYEFAAIAEYKRRTLYVVTDTGEGQKFIIHPKLNFVGCHPDGLVNSDGVAEVKCPFAMENHFLNALEGEQITEYTPQMQGILGITGRKWVDFISYDPDFPPPANLAIHRIERDEQYIVELENRLVLFWELVQDYVQRFREKFSSPD